MFYEGRQIGSYTLLRKLGRGGFGEVWLAEKRSQFVTKKVAVKLPLDEQINFEAIRQEAGLWEQASGHPNVLPIIDADIVDGQVLIVSEYADGGSLADLLKREGKLSLQKTVEMTIGILSGLEFLHSRQIIHRDIKPQNILLQGDTPRLADFGISRAMNTTVISSAIIGTDAYMSPESFDGKRNVQTDIWSVGVVLYALLADRLPFPQEHPSERMFAILTKEFEALSEDVPQNLQRIVAKALAKQPENRYQTTAEMRDELQKVLLGIAHPTFAPTEVFRIPNENLPTLPTLGDKYETKEPVISPQSFNVPAPTQEAFQPESVVPNLNETPPTINQASFSPSQEINKPPPERFAFKAGNVEPEKDKKPKLLIKSAVIVSLAVLLLAGISTAGYFVYQKVVLIYQENKIKKDLFSGMSKQEMELLLEDANPSMLKRLKEDPEMKKQQIESLKQLFALANQAIKEGLTDDENTPKALETIDAFIWARTYDQEINKDKNTTPFSSITEDQVKNFYGEGDNLTAEQKQHAKDFDEFFKVQLNFARKNKSVEENTELSAEEKTQTRQEFAKIKIYENEAKAKVKSGALPEKFVKKVELQSKLQKLQFLSQLYSKEVLEKKAEVTDEDVQKYIAEHPELNPSKEKKAKAMEVLQRLKSGEDFAALAKQYSDDPGSKEKGGLYEGVTEGGSFDKDFEAAALALQPGQISPNLVETPFGYHIIKLEKKATTKDSSGQVKQTYNVRHIFFSTMIKDPNNRTGLEKPVKEYVKQKLEDEKQKKVLDKILADNPVSIAEDFQIREVSDEEIRKSQQQQMSNSQSNSSRKNIGK